MDSKRPDDGVKDSPQPQKESFAGKYVSKFRNTKIQLTWKSLLINLVFASVIVALILFVIPNRYGDTASLLKGYNKFYFIFTIFILFFLKAIIDDIRRQML